MSEVFDSTDFGRSIRDLRRARGWTQVDLARWLAVSRTTVIALEQGRSVSLELAMRAMALLGAKAVIVPKNADLRAETR